MLLLLGLQKCQLKTCKLLSNLFFYKYFQVSVLKWWLEFENHFPFWPEISTLEYRDRLICFYIPFVLLCLNLYLLLLFQSFYQIDPICWLVGLFVHFPLHSKFRQLCLKWLSILKRQVVFNLYLEMRHFNENVTNLHIKCLQWT